MAITPKAGPKSRGTESLDVARGEAGGRNGHGV